MILASKRVAGGTIVKKACKGCGCGFWTGHSQQDYRNYCADCDPPVRDAMDHIGVGRNLDRKQSDRQYHGRYQD